MISLTYSGTLMFCIGGFQDLWRSSGVDGLVYDMRMIYEYLVYAKLFSSIFVRLYSLVCCGSLSFPSPAFYVDFIDVLVFIIIEQH